MSPSEYLLQKSHLNEAHTFPQYWSKGSTNFVPYTVGQKVAKKIIARGHYTSNKFKLKWEGPFMVTK